MSLISQTMVKLGTLEVPSVVQNFMVIGPYLVTSGREDIKITTCFARRAISLLNLQ